MKEGMRVAGTAYTVAGCPGDNLALHRALYCCPPGRVVVATVNGGTAGGHWGALMGAAAKQKGILGLVIDGTIRDPNELGEMAFPVFAPGANPRKTTKLHKGQLNVPINCAGVPVNPGDIVICDEHGAIVISADAASAILGRARDIELREREILARIQRGEQLADILGLDVM